MSSSGGVDAHPSECSQGLARAPDLSIPWERLGVEAGSAARLGRGEIARRTMSTQARDPAIEQPVSGGGYVVDPHAVAEAILSRRSEAQRALISWMLEPSQLDGLAAAVPKR